MTIWYGFPMEHQRYYENVLPSYEAFKEKWPLTHPEDGTLSSESLLEHFKPILEQGIKEGLQEISSSTHLSTFPHRDYTIYSGLSGIALMYLRLATSSVGISDRPIHLGHCQRLLQIALEHIESEESRRSRHSFPITFLCGVPGVYAVFLHFHTIQAENTQIDPNPLIEKFIGRLHELNSYFTSSALKDPGLADELLYGRVGYLYTLLYLYRHTNIPINRDLMKRLVDTIVTDGQRLAEQEKPLLDLNIELPPLFYRWRGRDYAGAAHGLAGILSILLLADHFVTRTFMNERISINKEETVAVTTIEDSTPYRLLDKDQLELIRQSLRVLLRGLRFENTGNYPSRYLERDRDDLVQFCHGAPGFVLMYVMAYEYFGDREFLEAAKDAADRTVWVRGLLRKGSGLCHGISGNAYTFLALYRVTRDLRYLYQALAFASFLVTNKQIIDQQRIPPYDSPFSLLEGLAGDIYLYAELLNLRDGTKSSSSSTSTISSTTVLPRSTTKGSIESFPAFPGLELSMSAWTIP
jgi:hypothetical protein